MLIQTYNHRTLEAEKDNPNAHHKAITEANRFNTYNTYEWHCAYLTEFYGKTAAIQDMDEIITYGNKTVGFYYLFTLHNKKQDIEKAKTVFEYRKYMETTYGKLI